MNDPTMDGERAVVLDVSEALFAAAERLPSGSPWIDAFCEIAQLIEGDAGPGSLSARERLRRRGIQARARAAAPEAGCARIWRPRRPEAGSLARQASVRSLPPA